MIKLCVSSNIKYTGHSLPKLLKSMKSSGLNDKDIFIFIGGAKKNYTEVNDGVSFFYTKSNSFDYTPIVSLLEFGLLDIDCFLIHDTCECLDHFSRSFYGESVQKFKNTYHNVRLCLNGFSNSMGIYSKRFILENKNLISKYLANRPKQFYIDNENAFFTNNNSYIEEFSLSNYSVKADVYGTGVMRYVEVYPKIGLVKYKANHCCSDILSI